MRPPFTIRTIVVVAALCLGGSANAQLRVAAWNITNWGVTSLPNARATAFQTSFYGNFMGRSMSPDIVMLSEVQTAAGLNTFVQLMNQAPGSPGDWAAYGWPSPIAPQLTLPDTQSACVYRTSKITPAGPVVTVSQGGGAPEPPRNTYRFDFYPAGYVAPGALMSVYNVHLKAGSAGSDESRRLLECQRIRLDANNLSVRGGIMVVGDFNISSSSAGSYQQLVGNQADNTGRVFDPINSPGTWGDQQSARFLHTQDQSNNQANVGMDDRYDFITMSSGLIDGDGLHYIGNANLAYSTTTWNDPNHSYRSYGNDGGSWIGGQSFGLRVTGNTMVGPTVAQALIDSTGGQSGHLPVIADLRVPPVAATDVPLIDFGLVGQGFVATAQIQINNVGNMSLWGADGIADLTYSFNTSGAYVGPGGAFTDRADDGPKTHTITLDTSNPGRINGTVTITTNDPLRPTMIVNCTALVAGRIIRPTPVVP